MSLLDRFDDPDFFGDLRAACHDAWARHEPPSFVDRLDAGVGGVSWQNATRWASLSDAEIDAAEAEWGRRFPDEYRDFLRALGGTDRPMVGAGFVDAGMIETEEPGFYDWRSDRTFFDGAQDWLFDGLLFDVEENDLWLDAWGERPPEAALRSECLRAALQGAPALLPLTSRRYLLVDGTPAGARPVLSVHQADIIVYATSLRRFLCIELYDLLDLDFGAAREAALCSYDPDDVRAIPFWGPLIFGEA